MTNRRIVEQYWFAFRDGDLDTYESLLHPDVVVTYPQSGEVFKGKYMASIRNYPQGLPTGDASALDTTEKSAATTSIFPFGLSAITLVHDGELLVGQAVLTYPNGEVYNTCSIFKVQSQLIAEETTYFAAPFDAPEWRSQWVDKP